MNLFRRQQNAQLDVHIYDSGCPGPNVIITGSIHGNEKGTVYGIHEFMTYLEQSKITLTKGKITAIPVVNLRAFNKSERCIDRDLNRNMRIYKKPKTHEDFICNALCPLLADADILIDLHAYEGGETAYVSCAPHNILEKELSVSIGCPEICWNFSNTIADARSEPFSIGTGEYIRQTGGVGIVIECGQKFQHDRCQLVAFESLINAVQFLDMADTRFIERKALNTPPEHISWHKYEIAYIKEKEGHSAKVFKHMDLVKKDTPLIYNDDGTVIKAPYDSFILMPRHEPEIGGDWMFIGKMEEPFASKAA